MTVHPVGTSGAGEEKELSPHQVGHDQGWGAAPSRDTVHQSSSHLVPVDPFSHWLKVFFKWSMRLVLDGDTKDTQAVHSWIGHALDATGVDDQRDVPAGQNALFQSRVQTTEEQSRANWRDRHPAGDTRCYHHHDVPFLLS